MKKPRPSVGRAGQRLDGVLGVRHQADDVAGRVGDAGDVAVRAVRVDVDVAGDDPALGLELVEGALVGDVAALAVLQRDDDLLAGARSRGPGGGRRSRPAAAGRGRRSAGGRCGSARRAAGATRTGPGSRCRCRGPAGPSCAPATTDSITGEKRAMAPHRR